MFVGAVDSSYILGDHFHWLTVELEGKSSVSWEYCPDSTSLVPRVESLYISILRPLFLASLMLFFVSLVILMIIPSLVWVLDDCNMFVSS